MAHVIQLPLGAFMSNLGVKGSSKSSEAHEHDQQFEKIKACTLGRVNDFQKRARLESIRWQP